MLKKACKLDYYSLCRDDSKISQKLVTFHDIYFIC